MVSENVSQGTDEFRFGLTVKRADADITVHEYVCVV